MARVMETNPERRREGAFWKSSILAGLIGGAVFMVAEMMLVMLTGESPWAPPRMIAAILLGDGVLPPPATFDIGILMTAMMIHFPLAILYGIVIGWVVQAIAASRALLIGAVAGLAIYLINFYAVPSVAFEWFAMARNWVSLVSHLLFGLVTAWAFVALTRRPVANV